MTQPQPPQPPQGVGWYPFPLDSSQRIYWDGTTWSAPVPASALNAGARPVPSEKSDTAKKTGVAIGVVILAVVGLVMSQQSVTMFSGSGQIWTGVAIAGVATAVAFFMGAEKWARVIAIICVAAALASAVYIENQLSEKRNELSQIFDN